MKARKIAHGVTISSKPLLDIEEVTQTHQIETPIAYPEELRDYVNQYYFSFEENITAPKQSSTVFRAEFIVLMDIIRNLEQQLARTQVESASATPASTLASHSLAAPSTSMATSTSQLKSI
ncbi:hypothetical protein ACLOJK_006010 [Asimina triloba]